MRVTKILTTSVTAAALAFSMLASAIPASAANPGFHGAWVAQSAYATAAPGQTVQMSAVYQNTGDNPWIKGTAGQQANFGAGSLKDPAYPRNTTAYADAGWNSGQNWLSANRFAAQANDLVATSGLGSWVWSVRVPASQAQGVTLFHGTPVIDGSTWLEDYGFFLQITVVSGTVKIDTTTPTSPSTTSQPVVNGSGAPASATVSLFDGSAPIGTGTADTAGKFAISTTPLAEGSHTLSATATDSTGAFFASGNTLTYVVDRTAATVSSVTAPGVRTIVVQFSEKMKTSSTAGNGGRNPANYTLDAIVLNAAPCNAAPATSISASTDGTTFTITLSSAGGCQMLQPSGHTLTVSAAIADAAGNTPTSATTVPFTVNDATSPTLSSASATAPSGGTTTSVTITWSEPIQCNNIQTVYNIDGVTVTSATPGATGATAGTCTLVTGGTQTLAAGSTHTVTVTNEKDAAGNNQSPNPTSASFTVATGTATISLVSSNISGETSVQVVWSGTIAAGPTGTYTTRTPTNVLIANGGVTRDATNTSAADYTLAANPFTLGGCNGATQTSCVLTIDVTGETGASAETQSAPILTTQVTVTKDTTKPTLLRVDQTLAGVPSTTQTQFEIVWSESLAGAGNPGACAATTCPVRIKAGTTLVASSIVAEAVGGVAMLTITDGTASDAKFTMTSGAAIAGGSYTLSAGAAIATDQAGTPNTNDAGSVPMSVTDTTRPTVTPVAPVAGQCGATQPCKTFTFTFSEKMATSGSGSVIDITHFTLNGAAVTGTAQVDTTGTIVTVDLTANAPAGANQFQVTGVTDAAGNTINPNPTLTNFTRVP